LRQDENACDSLKKFFRALALYCHDNLFAALPQTDSGTVRGTVTDATGAVVRSGDHTGQYTNRTSSSTKRFAGAFDFESVSATVQGNVEAQGFQTQEQLFELQVSQTQSLNFSLRPGAANTTITVTGAAPIVDVSTSTSACR